MRAMQDLGVKQSTGIHVGGEGGLPLHQLNRVYLYLRFADPLPSFGFWGNKYLRQRLNGSGWGKWIRRWR